MIQFKVIRASRLLLAVAILLLAAVLGLIGARVLAGRQPAPVSGSASLVQAAEEDDEAKTALVFASSDSADSLLLDPGEADIEIEILASDTEAPAASPRVLIYHTHTHEAYEQVAEDPYDALEAWRTADADHSVVRVGEALSEALRGYGFEVIHDTTDHEGDQLSTAYTRSLKTLESYEQRFDLYIDLHRDAYADGEIDTVASQSGEALAPLMLLVGNGNGFDVKPWYEQNYAFACALEKRINAIEPGLCKPVLVKDGRYNQHIGVFSTLIEVGHNRNTLAQALGSVPPLAKALYSLMVANTDPQLERMKAERAGL